MDLVVSGHSHSCRQGEQSGVTCLVVAGGGGDLSTIFGCDGAPYWEHMHTALAAHHYNMMSVCGHVLTWAACDETDQVIDTFDIVH